MGGGLKPSKGLVAFAGSFGGVEGFDCSSNFWEEGESSSSTSSSSFLPFFASSLVSESSSLLRPFYDALKAKLEEPSPFSSAPSFSPSSRFSSSLSSLPSSPLSSSQEEGNEGDTIPLSYSPLPLPFLPHLRAILHFDIASDLVGMREREKKREAEKGVFEGEKEKGERREKVAPSLSALKSRVKDLLEREGERKGVGERDEEEGEGKEVDLLYNCGTAHMKFAWRLFSYLQQQQHHQQQQQQQQQQKIFSTIDFEEELRGVFGGGESVREKVKKRRKRTKSKKKRREKVGVEVSPMLMNIVSHHLKVAIQRLF